jgi:transposase InsO family protein
MLDTIAQRMPITPKVIQVDGGSEFKAVFEKACAQRGIRLFVLPPHSPKLNGMVERMNRTSREEIYDLGLDFTLNIEEHNQLLEEQDHIYNHIRPHEALGLRTPDEYYKSIITN